MKAGNIIPIAIVIAGVLIFIGIIGLGFTNSQNTPPAQPEERVTVAWSPFESTALFWIAEEQDFFPDNGINITLKKYDSGSGALQAVMNGEADLCIGTTEFPLLGMAFRDSPARALATMDKGEFIYLVARQDRIPDASALIGKKVGTTRGTVAEFHLGRFLTLHGMRMQDLAIVDVPTPDGWVNDVADGKIDAISTAQPYANAARDRLGSNALVIPIQSGQPVFALVISSESWIQSHPGSARGFLAALVQAEEYASSHPAESRQIVQERLDFEPAYMDTVWQQNRFSVTLDHSLVSAMEAEARWMIANNLTDRKTVPDVRRYIHDGILSEIRPGSVRIIG